MRQLDVDMLSILDAIDAHGDAPRGFFDQQTGEVEHYFDELATGIEPDFDPDDDRYVEVPRRQAQDSIAVMREFIAGVDEDDVRERLERALDGRGAFGRFRSELANWADLRARFEARDREDLLARALAFLQRLQIEPRYQLPPLPAPAAPPARREQRIGLCDLLLLGAPKGKTELLEGRVHRVFVADDAGRARRVFADLAREITEQAGIGWRKLLIEGRSDYRCGRYELTLDDNLVHLEVDVPPPIWDAFRRG